MFGYLVLLFTILPAVELAVLIHVGSHIGAGNTIMIIILTGVCGAYLARIQGFLVVRDIQSRLEQGGVPTREMLDGLMIFGGGILLLTPGFITDIFGFCLLFPMTRVLIKVAVEKMIQAAYSQGPSNPSSRETHVRHRDFEDADFHE